MGRTVLSARLIAGFLATLFLVAVLVPTVSIADTAGLAVAVLYFEPPPEDEEPEEEVAGGGGAIECIPFCAPPLPSLYASKYARWVDDDQAASPTTGERTLRYVVLLENVSPVVVEDILYVEVLAPHLRLVHDSVVAPGTEAQIYEVADAEVITVSVPLLAPEETYELEFTVRVAGETSAASVLVGQGIVYAEGSSPVLTDDPTTEPLQDVTRTVVSGPSLPVGQTTELAVVKTATVIEEKRAFRVVDLGGVVEYEVSLRNTASEAMGNVCVYDLVGPHLYVDPESLEPEGATIHTLGPITVVTAEFPELPPGQSGVLRYRTEIGYDVPPEVTYTCSRALAATAASPAGFSDDPATRLADDPTAVLFPYRCSEVWDWYDWLKLISSAPTGLWPLVNREISGEEQLHWVLYGGDFFGDVSAHPAVRNPSWPERALVGLVEMPDDAVSKPLGFRLTHREEAPVREFLEEEPLLMWSVYGLPVYGRIPLTDTGDLLWLEGVSEYELCDEGYLPLLVDLEEAYDWRMAWLEDYMIYATVLEETAD